MMQSNNHDFLFCMINLKIFASKLLAMTILLIYYKILLLLRIINHILSRSIIGA